MKLKVRNLVVVFIFAQMSGLGFNLWSDGEPFKDLNLVSEVILTAFLQNDVGHNAEAEQIEGETETGKQQRWP